MIGKILKGISGFYYVHVVESGIYECKAKGIFRQQNIKPLVGDMVEITVIDEEQKKGNLVRILPRKNELIRPAVANVDMALIVFAAKTPDPNFQLLDRFLVLMARQQVPVCICFNKSDLVSDEVLDEFARVYRSCGYPVEFISVKQDIGIDRLMMHLSGKTSTIAGPSGAGKSSLINRLQSSVMMETGAVSKKLGRGKQTTRHTQLIHIEGNSYIMDTPGFSSLYLPQMDKEELQGFYSEFAPFEPECRFGGCSHISEPDCGVKKALEEGKVSKVRYENYVQLYEELLEQEKKKY
ncbi:MAG: ribosome small subunit-dependent GTPase A [bacterium]|nr:ribosome small subunit-dependent GTPase A [bacterium]